MTLSIFAAAAEAGATPAVVIAGRTISFAELGRRTEERLAQVAGEEHRPVAPRPVALVGEATLGSLELVLACFALGVPAVLLHPRSPPTARVAFAAELGARLLETSETGGDAPLRGEASHEPRAPAARDPGAAELAAAARSSPPNDDRALVVIATSGSSGAPKAVILSRRAIVASARASAAHLGWEPDDRWLLALPLAHVGGLSVLTRCLIARRTVVVPPSAEPAALAEVVTRERVTLLSLVPTQVARLLAVGFRPPPSVRAILVGGAPCPADVLARAAAAGWPLLTTYGLTETSSQVTVQPRGTAPHPDLGAGLPLPGIEVTTRGERIAVRGPTLATGYVLGCTEAPTSPGTARASGAPPWVVEPLPLDAEGWFVTADLGHLDPAGRLHVHGRADTTLITGGEKVMPERIEAELLGLPEIAEAAVAGRPDHEWGQRVVAFVVWSGDPMGLDELRARLRGRLAAHELPRELHGLAELPRSPSGKLDRPLLAALVARFA